jgi:phosphohistidine swiveling domain-containing protein
MQLDTNKYKNVFKWEFEGYPFFTSVYTGAADEELKNKYYTCYSDFISKFEDGKTIAFVPSQPILDIGNATIQESLNGDEGYLKEIKLVHEEIHAAVNACLDAQSKKVTDLSSWWSLTKVALGHAAGALTHFDYTFDTFLMDIKKSNPDDYQIIHENISNDNRSFIDEAGEYLLHLHEIHDDEHIVNSEFNKKFGWFQNSYKGPFNISNEWLNKFYLDTKNNKRTHGISSRVSGGNEIPERLNIIVSLVNEIIIFRDDKKKLLLIAVELMDKYLRAQCLKNNWDYEAMLWLTLEENIEAEKDSGLVQRAKKYNQNRLRISLMRPTFYLDVSKGVWQEVLGLYENIEGVKEVKGVVASKGIVNGRVKVILDPKNEAEKFEKGDILVTSMTRPEFLPLMSLAGAFVTDEGGISSHAAIVARELKKPCIIGTKNGTRVLKDGDMVEVDANNGIVKILS